MYEKFRNMVLAELEGKVRKDDIRILMEAMDTASRDFDIKEAERSLVIWQGDLPSEAKMYLVSMKMKGLSDGTANNYRLCLSNFFRIVAKPLSQVTTNDVRAYFYLYRQQKHISDRSADKYRQYLHGFFSWCVDN